MSEHARRHSAALYWHDSGRHWAPSRSTAMDSSSASTPYSGVSFKFTASSPVEETRRSRLASKSITGLNSLWTTLRSKSNDPPSKRQKPQRPHSTSSVDVSSLDVWHSPQSYLQAQCQFLHSRGDTRPDLSALVPDYLSDPPPYSSPIREVQEVIDWKAHFDSNPLLTRTLSPHTSPAIQDVRSPAAEGGGAWERAARRLSR